MSEERITSHRHTTAPRARINGVALSVALLGFFALFAFWSGVPDGERALAFWIGVALVVLMLMTFSWIAWYLLFRPLTVEQTIRVQLFIDARYRQALDRMGALPPPTLKSQASTSRC